MNVLQSIAHCLERRLEKCLVPYLAKMMPHGFHKETKQAEGVPTMIARGLHYNAYCGWQGAALSI